MCCGEPTGQLEDETCQHFPKTCAVLHSLPSVMWMYNATRCTNGAIAKRRPLRLLNAAKLVHSGRNSAQNPAQTGSGSGQEDNGSCRSLIYANELQVSVRFLRPPSVRRRQRSLRVWRRSTSSSRARWCPCTTARRTSASSARWAPPHRAAAAAAAGPERCHPASLLSWRCQPAALALPFLSTAGSLFSFASERSLV